MGPSSGPDIQLFQHFQLCWPKLHRQPQDARPLVEAPPDILRFLEITMDTKQPREDYIELIHFAAVRLDYELMECYDALELCTDHAGWQKLSTR